MTPISFRISNHMRVYQDVVVGIRGRKVQLMYQQREKFSSCNSLMTSSAKHLYSLKKHKGRAVADPASFKVLIVLSIISLLKRSFEWRIYPYC